MGAPNVVAVTAANAAESSYGYYCFPHDTVNGKRIGSCLGDVFSIKWMEDSDRGFMATETVAQQISKVRREVSKSHVQQFGDSSVIGAEVIGEFEGYNVGNASKLSGAMNSLAILEDGFAHSAVNSRDIDVHLAYSKMQQAVTLQQRREAQTAVASVVGERMALDEKFMRIAMLAVNGDRVKAQAMIDGDLEALGNVGCHVHALEVVVESCGALDDYTMRYSRLFANLCSVANLPNEKIEQAVRAVCSPKKPEVVV